MVAKPSERRGIGRSLAGLLVGVVIAALLVGPAPLGAEGQPPLHFGCDPGPLLPPAESALPVASDDDALPEPDLATLHVGRLTGRPIDGVGFNLEHALWSCPRFHNVLDDELLRPFRPAVVRFDLSPFPLAG